MSPWTPRAASRPVLTEGPVVHSRQGPRGGGRRALCPVSSPKSSAPQLVYTQHFLPGRHQHLAVICTADKGCFRRELVRGPLQTNPPTHRTDLLSPELWAGQEDPAAARFSWSSASSPGSRASSRPPPTPVGHTLQPLCGALPHCPAGSCHPANSDAPTTEWGPKV